MLFNKMGSKQRHKSGLHRPQTIIIIPLLLLLACHLPSTHSFAAFFVDRRTSCFTSLLVDEVIMNHPVKHHTASDERISLHITPVDKSGSFHVEFVMPHDTKLMDVQYVLELAEDSPAKFVSPPANGGIGCNDSRVYGKPGDAPAIVKMNENVDGDAQVEIRGGWATGHEAVTLVEPLIMTINEESQENEHYDDDDAYIDDQAEAQHEEEVIEAEREEIQQEIAEMEKDVVQALEEKRMEQSNDDAASNINSAEEDVVETLEDSRKQMDQALNLLKDEIIVEKAAHVKSHEDKMNEMHQTQQEREEIRRIHAEEMKRKHHTVQQQLEHMGHHFKNKGPSDPRMEKLQHFKKMREEFKDNQDMLAAIDRREHHRIEEEHIKHPSQRQVDTDMEEIKQKVHERVMERHQANVDKIQSDTAESRRVEREKFHRMHDAMEKEGKIGVHEMIAKRDVKEVVDKLTTHLKKGLVRGGAAAYHGDVGEPLPSNARYALFGLFGTVGLVGVVRWYLDKRRRGRKGHTA